MRNQRCTDRIRNLPVAAMAIALTLGVTAPAAATTHVWPLSLNGAQVVPPTASPAIGEGTVTLDDVTGVVTVNGTMNVVNPTGAFVRRGSPTVNGPIILAVPIQWTTNTFAVTATLSPADTAAMLAGNTYLSVHSSTYPAGEIRGQINPDLFEFEFALSGDQEVPPNVSPATGSCTVILNDMTGTMTLEGEFSGLMGNVTVAHLHNASAGVNGPVVLPLSVTGGTTGTIAATTHLSAAHVAAMLAGEIYVNVKSTAFTAGEIRGQVLTAAPCPADIAPQPNGDGIVNVNDLLLVVGNWGATGANPADINGDLSVNVNDLLAVVGAWGDCP